MFNLTAGAVSVLMNWATKNSISEQQDFLLWFEMSFKKYQVDDGFRGEVVNASGMQYAIEDFKKK